MVIESHIRFNAWSRHEFINLLSTVSMIRRDGRCLLEKLQVGHATLECFKCEDVRLEILQLLVVSNALVKQLLKLFSMGDGCLILHFFDDSVY